MPRVKAALWSMTSSLTNLNALKNLRPELAAVAARHFDAYTRGNLVSKPPTSAAPELIGDHKRDSHTPAPSYATAACHGRSGPVIHNTRGQNIQGLSGLQASGRSYRPDDRLFVHLNEESRLHKLSAYAIQSHLRSKLGAESQLLANVQPTKTGFALCPNDGNTSKLKDKIESIGFFGDAALEPASLWVSYRIQYVRCRHGAINDDMEHCLKPVTATAMHDTLTAAVGVSSTAVLPSRDNEAYPNSPSTTWIARFPVSHRQLPRTPFLFGCRTTTRVLPQRHSVIQYTRCWLWHNSRTCASPPRFRLCGTSQHTEDGHGNQYAATSEHICPPRCIHCHGPHPADDIKRELRPKASSSPKTKAQVSAIRQISAESRLRRQTEAGCVMPSADNLRKPSNPVGDKTTVHANPQNINTSPMTALSNRFTILNDEAAQSNGQPVTL
ncbi:hypothetical protein K3495_g2898 [Podosphaera aphanis]|nr:hypothetical protein K3495_g2898 [Podosphaera aphanis]